MQIIEEHAELLDSTIIYDRDFGFDYFGFKTLEKSYLLKVDGKIAERPQHMYMRVAVGIHKEDIESAIKTYHLMSERWMTHATPTLFNAGSPKPQMSSCFLLTMKEDSIDGIYDTLKQTAKISQSAGGIGLAIHNSRATGSYIGGTNGTSNGNGSLKAVKYHLWNCCVRHHGARRRYYTQAGRNRMDCRGEQKHNKSPMLKTWF